MSSSTEFVLSDLAQRALGICRDRRAHPGDLPLRAGVLGRPSPADVVQMLDEAAQGVGAGVCLNRQAAERLLQRLAALPWLAEATEPTSLGYTLKVSLLQGEAKVMVRRQPAPHIWAVG